MNNVQINTNKEVQVEVIAKWSNNQGYVIPQLSNVGLKALKITNTAFDNKSCWIIDQQKNQLCYCVKQDNLHKKYYRFKAQEVKRQGQNQRAQNNQIKVQNSGLAQFFNEQKSKITPEQLADLLKSQRTLKQKFIEKAKQIKDLEQQISSLKGQLKGSSINQQNKTHKENKTQKIKIPDPVSYAPIKFYDQEKLIRYTDCWEISLLRFLHLLFGENGTINQQKLTYFMDLNNKHCKKLIQYFKQNPTYKFEKQFYQTEEGFEIRSLWGQFLNNSKLLYVKLDKKYEVAATIPNLFQFWRGFFPKLKIGYDQLMTYQNVLTKQLFENHEHVLSQIYTQLSQAAGFDIGVKLKVTIQYSAEYIYFSAVQQIYLNNQQINELQWQIYEYYHLTDLKTIKQRWMGHSDFRYNKKLKEKQEEEKETERYEKELLNQKEEKK